LVQSNVLNIGITFRRCGGKLKPWKWFGGGWGRQE
jgi:hypothetical protein